VMRKDASREGIKDASREGIICEFFRDTLP